MKATNCTKTKWKYNESCYIFHVENSICRNGYCNFNSNKESEKENELELLREIQ